MASHGYLIRSPTVGAKQSPTVNAAGWKLFNVPTAQKYGYGSGVTGPPAPRPSETGAEEAQDPVCSKSVNVTMRADQATAEAVAGMAFAADDQAQADPSVKAAVARWHSCMLPLGIPDLPEFPLNAATDSQRARFHPLRVDGAASPAEITEAVFDAKCMDSSGFSNAYYQASLTYQLEAMVKHQDILTRALADKKAQEAVIAQVLKANGR